MFKRLVQGLAAAMLLGLMTVSCALADGAVFGLVHSSASVNLRQEPTQYSAWLGAYTQGEWVEIRGESGNWYYVVGPDGQYGYMSKNYVAAQEELRGMVGIVSNPRSTSYLNLREYPSYTAKVLGIYYNGVPCLILDRADGWYHVQVDGVEGHFREEYIDQLYTVYSGEVATVVTPGNTGLNLRRGPGKQYASMAQYPGGSYVMVLQRGAAWWRVSVDGNVGYMDASFLKDGVHRSEQKTETSYASGEGYAVVTNPRATQVLNFRQTAATTSRVLGQYRNGAKLYVLNQGTEWCRLVNEEGVTGYMMTQYLKLYNLPSVPSMTVIHPDKTFVYLRTLPSKIYGEVMLRVLHGAEVVILVPGDEWMKVEYGGKTGYMMAAFLQ